MVIRTVVFRWLLRLFPAEFRQQFAEDIADYLRLRHLEVHQLGRWSRARLSAHMAADLTVAAFKLRASAASTARTAVWLAALLGGLGLSVACLSVVLVAFEAVVRAPLLAIAKHGSDVGLVPRVGVMVAIVAALASFYVSIRPGPQQGRQSPNQPD